MYGYPCLAQTTKQGFTFHLLNRTFHDRLCCSIPRQRSRLTHPAVYIGSFISVTCLLVTSLTYMVCYSSIQMSNKAKHSLSNTWVAISALCLLFRLVPAGRRGKFTHCSCCNFAFTWAQRVFQVEYYITGLNTVESSLFRLGNLTVSYSYSHQTVANANDWVWQL